MSVYCTLVDKQKEKEAQVKMGWPEEYNLQLYNVGDKLPKTFPTDLEGDQTYSIALREGGYMNVYLRELIGWSLAPMYRTVLTKYGEPFYKGVTGPFGEPYLLSETKEWAKKVTSQVLKDEFGIDI